MFLLPMSTQTDFSNKKLLSADASQAPVLHVGHTKEAALLVPGANTYPTRLHSPSAAYT